MNLQVQILNPVHAVGCVISDSGTFSRRQTPVGSETRSHVKHPRHFLTSPSPSPLQLPLAC